MQFIHATLKDLAKPYGLGRGELQGRVSGWESCIYWYSVVMKVILSRCWAPCQALQAGRPK